MTEFWKPVPVEGFQLIYLISDLGNVARSDDGKPGRRIATTVGWSGYPTCYFSHHGKRRACLVHRLVAMAFVNREREDQAEVNHKDGIKTNCVATNLEWVNRTENNNHAWATGLRILRASDGGKHHFVKLDESQVAEIKRLLPMHRNGELAKMFHVHEVTISRIRRGLIWKLVAV